MIDRILKIDALKGIQSLPDKSIDCIVTSPPYWNLRDYEIDGQIGLEDNFNDYIASLVEIFVEAKRVLKDTGTMFINLGDTYAGSGNGTTKNADAEKYKKNSKQSYVIPNGISKSSELRSGSLNKSLLMIPERFAIRMIDNNWVLRNQIIWHKPNQMPHSVKDRFTVDFEKIFFFVKNPTGYYFEQQLEGAKYDGRKDINYKGGNKDISIGKHQRWKFQKVNETEIPMRNVRTTWSVNTKPFKEAHFATFPEELACRMIQAGCPNEGLVLDPFMGAGTTAVVAKKLNRHYLGFDINDEYIAIAENRIRSEGILQQSINMQPFEVNITQEILAKAIERIIEDSFTEERNALIKKQESIDYFNSKKRIS